MFTQTMLWKKGSLIAKDGFWDRCAVLLSGLCLVHCVTTAVLVALLSSAGGALLNPLIHESGLAIAIGLGIFALSKGFIAHGYITPLAVGSLGLGMMIGALSLGHDGDHGQAEILFTMLGVCVLALGHDLNYRATH